MSKKLTQIPMSESSTHTSCREADYSAVVEVISEQNETVRTAIEAFVEVSKMVCETIMVLDERQHAAQKHRHKMEARAKALQSISVLPSKCTNKPVMAEKSYTDSIKDVKTIFENIKKKKAKSSSTGN